MFSMFTAPILRFHDFQTLRVLFLTWQFSGTPRDCLLHFQGNNLLMSAPPLWSVPFFLLLSWEACFAIRALSRGEIRDRATDFQRKFAKTNFTILRFHVDERGWPWREGFVREIPWLNLAVSLASSRRAVGDSQWNQ